MDTHTYSVKNARRGSFSPLLLDHVDGLNDHTIKHLQHRNQIPPAVPRQGMTYLQAKAYLA